MSDILPSLDSFLSMYYDQKRSTRRRARPHPKPAGRSRRRRPRERGRNRLREALRRVQGAAKNPADLHAAGGRRPRTRFFHRVDPQRRVSLCVEKRGSWKRAVPSWGEGGAERLVWEFGSCESCTSCQSREKPETIPHGPCGANPAADKRNLACVASQNKQTIKIMRCHTPHMRGIYTRHGQPS